jgi:hypothetical protein
MALLLEFQTPILVALWARFVQREAVFLATYFLIGEHGVGTLDPLRVILWSFLVAAVALNLISPVTGLDTTLLDEPASLLRALAQHHAPVWAALPGSSCWAR